MLDGRGTGIQFPAVADNFLEYGILDCDDVLFGRRISAFQRILLAPSSGRPYSMGAGGSHAAGM